MYRLLCALSLSAAFFCIDARAQGIEHSRTAFARQVYANAAAEINHDAPQALLRAVVVLRIRLTEEGRWSAEVLRDNSNEPQLTRKAIESVERAPAPKDIPDGLRPELQRNGFVEAWLFQSNGRFALKTLALPQRDS